MKSLPGPVADQVAAGTLPDGHRILNRIYWSFGF
jgi:hypothetical protein